LIWRHPFETSRRRTQASDDAAGEKLVTDGMNLSGSASRFDFGLACARRDRDALVAEATRRSNTVSQLQKEIEQMSASAWSKSRLPIPPSRK